MSTASIPQDDAGKPQNEIDLTPITDEVIRLLIVSESIQEFARMMAASGDAIDSQCYVIESLGKHLQDIRNDLVRKLEPVYKAFNQESPGW